MKQLILVLCYLKFVVTNFTSTQDDYSYDYYGVEDNDKNCQGEVFPLEDNQDYCTHNTFTVQPLSELPRFRQNEKINFCCNEHAYVALDQCETRATYSKNVCVSPQNNSNVLTPKEFTHKLKCPAHCKLYRNWHRLRNHQFVLDSNGNFTLTETHPNFKFIQIHDYCISYFCDYEQKNWAIGADVCICYQDSLLNTIEEEAIPSKKYARCCNKPNLINITNNDDQDYQYDGQNINCPTTGKVAKTCKLRFEEIHLFHPYNSIYGSNITENGTMLRVRRTSGEYSGEELELPLNSSDYCVALTLQGDDFKMPVIPVLEYCKHKFCQGTDPCIKTCHRPDEMIHHKSNGSLPYVEMTNEIQDQLLNNQILDLPDDKRILRSNVYQNIAFKNLDSIGHFNCPKHYGHMRLLLPSQRCNDIFSIEFNSGTSQTSLHIDRTEEVYENYCLRVHADYTYTAIVCQEKYDSSTREGVYSALLILSSILLLLTIVIYTCCPKLLTNLSKLMRHYTFVLFLAFSLLTMNKFIDIETINNKGACQFIGFISHYTFISSFAFMTATAIETWTQLRGNLENDKRYLMLIMCGYILPLIWSMAIIIVEFASPKCAAYKPNFGEDACFFTHDVSKGIWFYLPLAIALLINFCLFISIIWMVKRHYQQMKQATAERSNNQKEEILEKGIMFLKLFFGMGLIWTMEIIAGVSEAHWAFYFFDVLNTLQGAWIFAIFVCKRKVLKVLLVNTRWKKASTTSGSKGGNYIQMSQLGQDNEPLTGDGRDLRHNRSETLDTRL